MRGAILVSAPALMLMLVLVWIWTGHDAVALDSQHSQNRKESVINSDNGCEPRDNSEVLVTVRLAQFELGKPVLRSSDACVHKRVPSDAFHFVLQLILVR